MDHPSTAGRPSWSAEIKALVWSAMTVMVSGDPATAVWPTPELSNTTTRCWAASASTNDGAQSSMDPPHPTISSRGVPPTAHLSPRAIESLARRVQAYIVDGLLPSLTDGSQGTVNYKDSQRY